jgi:hypothetical protein
VPAADPSSRSVRWRTDATGSRAHHAGMRQILDLIEPWPASVGGPVQTRVARRSIAGALIGVALCVILLAACSEFERSLPAEAPPAAATPAAAAPTAPVAAGTGTRAEAPHAESTRRAPIRPEPATPPTARVATGAAPQDTARPAASAREPAKGSPSPSPATRVAKDVATAAAPATPGASTTLDLKSLETRLKQTPAIGVFTKLALKNQIDALLDQFRAHHQRRSNVTMAQLRRSYDLLVLKVLALLQDTDPPLAGAIASSREPIWGILSDPVKFAAV